MEQDNKLDLMFERLMREDALESPSNDFTDKVMNKVYALEVSTATQYEPLISKRAWYIIGLLFVSLVGYVMLNGNSGGGQWLTQVQIPSIEFNLLDNLDFQLSQTLSYGIIFLAIMMGVQVTVLKTYFDKRLST